LTFETFFLYIVTLSFSWNVYVSTMRKKSIWNSWHIFFF